MAAHFTIAERQLLHRLLQRKLSKAEIIAVLLNRHRSTVYRELDRNSSAFGYRPKHALHALCVDLLIRTEEGPTALPKPSVSPPMEARSKREFSRRLSDSR